MTPIDRLREQIAESDAELSAALDREIERRSLRDLGGASS